MTRKLVRKIIGYPMLVYKQRVYRRFLESLNDPAHAQERKLQTLLKQLRGSDFGRDYDLDKVRTADDLRRALPVAGYERLAPYVERLKYGETQALFRPGTRVHMFATTSGTTAAVKYIPVTTLSLIEYVQSWTAWACGVAQTYPEMPYGGVVNMASNWRTRYTPAGIPCGSVTGLMFEKMHQILRLTHAVPPAVAQIDDTDLRYYLILRLALARQDTMMFNVANPSTLINLARCLNDWKDDLIRDLHDGTLRNAGSYPTAVRLAVRAALKQCHPGLAARLARHAHQGPLTPPLAWPALRLIGVWTGGTLSAYLQRLRDHYGDLPLRDHGLSASEGRITVPLADNTPSGALNLGGGFFEFIPEEAYGKRTYGSDVTPTYLAHELDVGQRYYVVLTTSGGLVRYDLSDVVECTGHIGRTPLLRFLHKGLHISNLTGEKLAAAQVTQAVTPALESHGIRAPEYVVAPVLPSSDELPGYHLLLEAAFFPEPQVAEALATDLDRRLCDANIEYADKRHSRRLAPLSVTLVPDGTFADLRAAKIRSAGAPPEHYKHPFLVTDPDYALRFPSVKDKLRQGA